MKCSKNKVKVDTILEISKKITECSQLDKIEILVSLRAFLLGYEDCPSFVFCECLDPEELVIEANVSNYHNFKKTNEINLKKIAIKPIDIFLLPKNKKNTLLDHINSILEDYYPDCIIVHDCVRTNPFSKDFLFEYMEENEHKFSDLILQIYRTRSINKNKLIKDAKIPKRVHETCFSISRKNKLIDYWKNSWGLSEKYTDQTIIEQIII